jgi:hypothetical protein
MICPATLGTNFTPNSTACVSGSVTTAGTVELDHNEYAPVGVAVCVGVDEVVPVVVDEVFPPLAEVVPPLAGTKRTASALALPLLAFSPETST